MPGTLSCVGIGIPMLIYKNFLLMILSLFCFEIINIFLG